MTARAASERGIVGAPAVALLAAAAALLLLMNLDGPRLWSDEADTAVFARTILHEGVPLAWDGRAFTESDRGTRLTDDLLMVGTPWVPYYVTAASFAVLGESAFAARLPFALAGIATVLLLHRLVLRATGNGRAAFAAGALLLCSVQFLLFGRQSRHYALNLAFGLAAVLSFLRLRERRRDPWFVIWTVLLFHSTPLPAAATLLGLGGLTLFHPAYRGLRNPFLARLPVVLLLTLPWALLSRSGWEENSSWPTALPELLPRLGQFLVEASDALPFLGWLVLAALAGPRLAARERSFLALAGSLIAAYAVLTPALLSADLMWNFGLRYCCGLLPLGAAVTGVLAAGATRGRDAALAALVALFGFTHLPGNAVLWRFATAPASVAAGSVAFHVPQGPGARWLRTEWLGFARELVRDDPGTESRIVDALEKLAGPDDRIVTNYDWEPIYFYTNRPPGLKVLPSHEIYAAARARGLPEYVFSVEGARWVVWRWAWEDYQGYHFRDVVGELERRGARLTPVEQFEETIWENRPELHFHRFPGLRYLYPDDISLLHKLRRPAPLYRVEWGTASGAP